MAIDKKRYSVFVNILMIISIYVVVVVNSTDVLSEVYQNNHLSSYTLYLIYDSFFPYNISSFVVILALIILVIKSYEVNFKWFDFLVSACVGVVSICGISFRINDTWNLVTEGSKFILLLYIIGVASLWRVLKGYLVFTISNLKDEKYEANFVSTLFSRITGNKLCTFLFVFACWVFWLIMRFPGGLQWDELAQIRQFMANSIESQHWPVFTTVYYGGFVYLGTTVFGSENVGLFLAILLQIVYGALIVAYTVSVLRKCNVRTLYITIYTVILAINPIIARYMSTASKDAAYAVTLLWLVAMMTEMLVTDNNCCIRDYAAIGICSILLCLIRKNGSYTILILFFVSVVFGIERCIKKKKNNEAMRVLIVSSVMLIGVIFEILFSTFLASKGIDKGPFRESLSVPLQQTARLSRDYKDIVSDEDISTINKVIDFEYIGDVYCPKSSDAVKDTYYGDNISDFIGYLKVWMKYLIKAPSIYIQAFLHMNGDFLDVNAYSIELTKLDPELIDRFKPWPIEGKFRVFTDFYERFPLVWSICNVGVQSWLSIYMLFMSVDKKNKTLFLLTMPAVITVIVCLLGPTFSNQGIRYLIPAMFVNPFVMNLINDDLKNDRKGMGAKITKE